MRILQYKSAATRLLAIRQRVFRPRLYSAISEPDSQASNPTRVSYKLFLNVVWLSAYKSSKPTDKATGQKTLKKKSTADLDEELRQKLEARSGGGGEAGLELEDGKPVAMKRSVKENMFRLI